MITSPKMVNYMSLLREWLSTHDIHIRWRRPIKVGKNIVITDVLIEQGVGISILGGYYDGLFGIDYPIDSAMVTFAGDQVRIIYYWGLIREIVYVSLGNILEHIPVMGVSLASLIQRTHYLWELRYQLRRMEYSRTYTNVSVVIYGPPNRGTTIGRVTISDDSIIQLSGATIDGFRVTSIDYEHDNIYVSYTGGSGLIIAESILSSLRYMGTTLAIAIRDGIFGTTGSGPPRRRRHHPRPIPGATGYTSSPRRDGRLVCLIGKC